MIAPFWYWVAHMQTQPQVIVVGAGPAGLMAAEVIAGAGFTVQVYDAKPSACRKFLLAGIGGLNITHAEDYAAFIQRYYEKADWLNTAISQFNANDLRQWVHNLGIATFVGSSGRVFPVEMKAAPLLRRWLNRLREAGVVFKMNHRLVDIHSDGTLTFDHQGSPIKTQANAVVLAMGGASWPKLGSTGAWQGVLQPLGVIVHPLQSANCAVYTRWSNHLQQLAGSPLKDIALSVTLANGLTLSRKGECIVSAMGMEGSLIYAFSKYVRDAINQAGEAQVHLDLLPNTPKCELLKKLKPKPAKESLSKYLKRSVGISGIKAALLYELCPKEQLQHTNSLADALKQLTLVFSQVAPIEEAISSAGGVCQSSLNAQFMLNTLPGFFCAGEMLDWEAPTGGYLLTACFATGRLAGQGACDYLQPD